MLLSPAGFIDDSCRYVDALTCWYESARMLGGLHTSIELEICSLGITRGVLRFQVGGAKLVSEDKPSLRLLLDIAA